MVDDVFGGSLRMFPRLPLRSPRSHWARSARLRQALSSLCLLGVIGGTVYLAHPHPRAIANSVPASDKPLLKTGNQGAAVTELQAMLKLMGFYQGAVTGVYDEPTAAAVTQFQKAANLTPDGIVGAATWNRLLPPVPAIAATPAPTSPSGSTADTFPTPGQATPPATQPTPKPPQPPAKTATGTPATGIDRPTTSDAATFPILRMGMRGPAVEGLQQRLRGLGFLKGAIDGVFGSETQTAVKAAQQKLKLEPDGIVGNATWQGLLR